MSYAVDVGNMFKPLVESNKLLEYVSISVYRSIRHRSKKRPRADSSLETLRQLLTIFSNCRKLELDLPSMEGQNGIVQDVCNICGVLPCRGVEVEIGFGPDFNIYSRTSYGLILLPLGNSNACRLNNDLLGEISFASVALTISAGDVLEVFR